jgi:PAS domain-containing protein
VWDALTAGVGVWYWSLRGRFPALVRGAALFEDLELRKAAERTLRASEQRYRRIIETTSEGILLVDARLHDVGCTVLTAADGAAALVVVDPDEPIDLILTDVVVPGMNGHELAAPGGRGTGRTKHRAHAAPGGRGTGGRGTGRTRHRGDVVPPLAPRFRDDARGRRGAVIAEPLGRRWHLGLRDSARGGRYRP